MYDLAIENSLTEERTLPYYLLFRARKKGKLGVEQSKT
jgi:hypothetical protein